MSSGSQYKAANIAPLIKSPSLWLPKPVEFPMDVHPLPDDISAYFVYPFTLEPHILSQQPPIHEKIRALRDEHARLLEAKAREEEEKRQVSAFLPYLREALNKIAPGYNPSTSLLVPQPRSTATNPSIHEASASGTTSQAAQENLKAPEDEFLSLKLF